MNTLAAAKDLIESDAFDAKETAKESDVLVDAIIGYLFVLTASYRFNSLAK